MARTRNERFNSSERKSKRLTAPSMFKDKQQIILQVIFLFIFVIEISANTKNEEKTGVTLTLLSSIGAPDRIFDAGNAEIVYYDDISQKLVFVMIFESNFLLRT